MVTRTVGDRRRRRAGRLRAERLSRRGEPPSDKEQKPTSAIVLQSRLEDQEQVGRGETHSASATSAALAFSPRKTLSFLASSRCFSHASTHPSSTTLLESVSRAE